MRMALVVMVEGGLAARNPVQENAQLITTGSAVVGEAGRHADGLRGGEIPAERVRECRHFRAHYQRRPRHRAVRQQPGQKSDPDPQKIILSRPMRRR